MNYEMDSKAFEKQWRQRPTQLPADVREVMEYKRRERRLSQFDTIDQLVELSEQMEVQ